MTTQSITDARDDLIDAIREASGSWTGLDWPQDFRRRFAGVELEVVVEPGEYLDRSVSGWRQFLVSDWSSVLDDAGVEYDHGHLCDLSAEVAEEICDYIADAERSAATAQQHADEALRLLESEHWPAHLDDVARQLQYAAELEGEFGDCPTWGGAEKLAAELVELAEEADR